MPATTTGKAFLARLYLAVVLLGAMQQLARAWDVRRHLATKVGSLSTTANAMLLGTVCRPRASL